MLEVVHCAGCRRPLGMARSKRGGIYCDDICLRDHPVSANESRDGLIEFLYTNGQTVAKIAREVGLTPQRVSQILMERVEGF